MCVIVCSHAKRTHTLRGHACSSADLIVCTHKTLPYSGHVSRTTDLNDHVCVCSSLLVRHAWADPSWPEGRERLSPSHTHTHGECLDSECAGLYAGYCLCWNLFICLMYLYSARSFSLKVEHYQVLPLAHY